MRHIARFGVNLLGTLCLVVALSACAGLATQAPESLPSSVLESPLHSSTLEAQGFDRRHWDAAIAEMSRRGLRIDQVALMVNGESVAQYHREGFSERTLHDMRSATKSITGLLAGIALDRGLLHSIDEPVDAGFAPLVAHPSRSAYPPIALRHLLTMRSGLDCDDWRASSAGNEERMYRGADWLAFYMALPARQAPGTAFSYCTAGVVALGEAVARAAREPLPRFARRVLFEPLGIAGERWAAASPTLTDAGGHLRLTLPAMLKIGELMRNGGRWQGLRVVSEAWVRASLEPAGSIDNGPPGALMGRLWWLSPGPDGAIRSYQARGNGGQYIVVLPELKAVIAFTGHAYNAPNAEAFAPFELVARYVAPMLRREPFRAAQARAALD